MIKFNYYDTIPISKNKIRENQNKKLAIQISVISNKIRYQNIIK